MKVNKKLMAFGLTVGVAAVLAACSSVQQEEMEDLNQPGPESTFESVMSDVGFWYATNFSDYSETQEIVVEQELKGVSVEMMNWWWDNIDTTARYRTWHPGDHISFKWVVEPERKIPGRYTPGAVQEVRERIAGIPATILIKWEPYDRPGYQVTEENFIKASGRLKGAPETHTQLFLHEYKPSENGIVMRSVFRLPADAPSIFSEGLATHCKEEMQYLAGVLPDYYEKRDL